MKKIKAVHIDDEKFAREGFAALLEKKFPEIELLGQAENALKGIQLIHSCKPDVVFSDVSMPGGNGLDMIEAIDQIDFELIFLTAFDTYAIKAIKKDAFDYLLKPIDVDELRISVEKLKKKLSKKSTTNRVLIHTMDKIELVDYNKIMYLQSENNYTHFYLEDGSKILASKSLSYFKKILPETDFKTVHQSYFVNFNKVISYKKMDNGFLVLSDQTEVPIARSKKQEVLAYLEA